MKSNKDNVYFHIAPMDYYPGQRFFLPMHEDIQPTVKQRIEAGDQIIVYEDDLDGWVCRKMKIASKETFCWRVYAKRDDDNE